MRIRNFAAALIAGAACAHLGCTQPNPVKNFFKSSVFRPPQTASAGSDSDSEWDFVGEEARKHREIEKDPDDWWKKYIMSEKARSIEHSLGVD